MIASEGSFTGSYRRRIVYRGWSPAGDQPSAIVVVAHGFAEHTGRYEHVAARLTDAGFAVFAPDHHGHGRSEGKRALISFPDAVADLDAVATQALAAYPARPLFLVGHSMGGGLALRYALAHGSRMRGLVLSGPLTAGEPRALLRAAAKLVGRLAPRAPTIKLDPRLLSRDPQVVADYIADPLSWHGAIPAGTAAEFVRHQESIFRLAATLKLPTLLMYGGADQICPPAGSEQLAKVLGSDDLTVRVWDGAYHEIFNEPERDAVLDLLCDWLNQLAP
jgi:alpha-beta hydrolase superfamily lysophospholipase